MNTTLPPPGLRPERRRGPHHELYIDHGSQHQTFVQSGHISADDCSTKRVVGVVASLLRQLADQIELHAEKDAFVTDWVTAWGDNPAIPSQPIKTCLVNMEASATIDVNDYGTHRPEVRLRLDFN